MIFWIDNSKKSQKMKLLKPRYLFQYTINPQKIREPKNFFLQNFSKKIHWQSNDLYDTILNGDYTNADVAQSVERRLGKAEVTGSIPVISLG